MKTNKQIFLAITFLFLCAGFASVNAQKVPPPYKVTAIKLVPFDQTTGKFQPEITATDDRAFFNELSLGVFVTVEISGESGNYTPNRKVEITVLEGKRVKAKRLEAVGIVGEDGKYYVPVYLDSALCDGLTVTARILGQKTVSTMKRTVSFMCGE